MEAAAFFPISGKMPPALNGTTFVLKKYVYVTGYVQSDIRRLYIHSGICVSVSKSLVYMCNAFPYVTYPHESYLRMTVQIAFPYFAKHRYTSMCVICNMFKISRHIQMKKKHKMEIKQHMIVMA